MPRSEGLTPEQQAGRRLLQRERLLGVLSRARAALLALEAVEAREWRQAGLSPGVTMAILSPQPTGALLEFALGELKGLQLREQGYLPDPAEAAPGCQET